MSGPAARPVVLAVLDGRSTESSGGEMRDIHLLRGLSRVADVEVVTLASLSEEACAKLTRRLGFPVSPLPGRPRPAWRAFLVFVTHRTMPFRAARFPAKALRAGFTSALEGVDAVCFRRPTSFALLETLVRQPIITDVDDLQSELARQQLGIESTSSPPSRGWVRLPQRVRAGARRRFLVSQERRWRDVERRVVERSTRVLVCSEEDRRLLGSSANTVVVPNGFEPPEQAAGTDHVRTPATIAFWGLMGYTPNADGARWLVHAVLPHLLELVPDARIVVAGAGGEKLGFRSAHVESIGFVPDLADLLRRTDVAVVPLRFGGGTRIKIVEAWANRIPVVSTTVGAHGLCATSGDGALLADEPAAFAASIHRLLADDDVRNTVVEEGARRARALRWSTIEAQIGDVMGDVLEHETKPDRGPNRAPLRDRT